MATVPASELSPCHVVHVAQESSLPPCGSLLTAVNLTYRSSVNLATAKSHNHNFPAELPDLVTFYSNGLIVETSSLAFPDSTDVSNQTFAVSGNKTAGTCCTQHSVKSGPVHLVSCNSNQLGPLVVGYAIQHSFTCRLGSSFAQHVGDFFTPDHSQWRAVSWHPALPGVLALICQAEVQVAICDVPAVDLAHTVGHQQAFKQSCKQQPEDAVQLMPQRDRGLLASNCICRESVRAAQQPGHSTTGAVLACAKSPRPTRSALLSCCWAGHGHKLVVCWGNDLEILSWEITSDGSCNWSVQPTRHALLLGFPGPIRALASLADGAVIATADAEVALNRPSPTAAVNSLHAFSSDADASQGSQARDAAVPTAHTQLLSSCAALSVSCTDGAAAGESCLTTLQNGISSSLSSTAVGGVEVTETVDLRGRWTASDTGGLFSISTSAHETSSASIPSRFLINQPDLSTPPSRLIIVWSAGQSQTAADCKAASAHGYAAQIGLLHPRPDILSTEQAVVAVGSSTAPPIIQLFRVSANIITPLRTISLAMPLSVLPDGFSARQASMACVRPRGVSLAVHPATHRIALVSLLGHTVESQPLPASFAIFSKSGSRAVHLAPLLLCAYTVPGLQASPASAQMHMQPSLPNHHAIPQHDTESQSTQQAAVPTAMQASGAECLHQHSSPPALSHVPATIPLQPAPTPAHAQTHTSDGLQQAAAPLQSSQAPASDVLQQLSGLLLGLQQHMDRRLDQLEGRLVAHEQRLSSIEGRMPKPDE